MPDASQFTLGLFDTTALGWTIHSPKAEPQPHLPDEDEIDQPPAPVAAP